MGYKYATLPQTLSAQESQECSRKASNESVQLYTSKTHEVRNTHVSDGGGGGGGGTYVFLVRQCVAIILQKAKFPNTNFDQ